MKLSVAVKVHCIGFSKHTLALKNFPDKGSLHNMLTGDVKCDVSMLCNDPLSRKFALSMKEGDTCSDPPQLPRGLSRSPEAA